MGLRYGQAATAWCGRLFGRMPWWVGSLLLMLVAVGASALPVGAASLNGVTTGCANGAVLCYGHASQGVVTAFSSPIQGAAATLQVIGFLVSFLVVVVGFILKQMHQSQQMQMTGATMVTRGFETIVGLLLAPFFLNILFGLKMGAIVP